MFLTWFTRLPVNQLLLAPCSVCSSHIELSSAPCHSPQAAHKALCPPTLCIIFCPYNHFFFPHIPLAPSHHSSRFSLNVTCRKLPLPPPSWDRGTPLCYSFYREQLSLWCQLLVTWRNRPWNHWVSSGYIRIIQGLWKTFPDKSPLPEFLDQVAWGKEGSFLF